jgi:hypothetical protein
LFIRLNAPSQRGASGQREAVRRPGHPSNAITLARTGLFPVGVRGKSESSHRGRRNKAPITRRGMRGRRSDLESSRRVPSHPLWRSEISHAQLGLTVEPPDRARQRQSSHASSVNAFMSKLGSDGHNAAYLACCTAILSRKGLRAWLRSSSCKSAIRTASVLLAALISRCNFVAAQPLLCREYREALLNISC